jgi:hypothetical protein
MPYIEKFTSLSGEGAAAGLPLLKHDRHNGSPVFGKHCARSGVDGRWHDFGIERVTMGQNR